MDYFAHGFWSYILFHRIRRPWLAVVFGLLPDTISWVPYAFYRLFTGGFQLGPPVISEIPDWQWMMYGVGHSFIVSLGVITLVYIFSKKVPVYMWAWPIVIFIDMLTHTREYLPTPVLWPVSGWVFPGISWGNSLFMIINWTLIIVCLGYIAYKKKSQKA